MVSTMELQFNDPWYLLRLTWQAPNWAEGCGMVMGSLFQFRLSKRVNATRDILVVDRSGRENCCWPSPARSFLVPGPVGLMAIFFLGVMHVVATVAVEEHCSQINN